MSALTVEKVHASSRPFIRQHGIRLPRPGETVKLGALRGEGGFGAVYPVRFGEVPVGPEILAKVVDIERLPADRIIENVDGLHRALESQPERNWPSDALGLPFAIATARGEQGEQLLVFMLDLGALGYVSPPSSEELERFRNDWDRSRRIEIAFNFARQARRLEELPFIHSDLNPENLMIHPGTLDVQIIDFDTGSVVRQGGEPPLTCNRPGGFMPPEVKLAGAGAQTDVTRFSLAAERWSVGYLIGSILFGVPPAFFLEPLTARVLDAYAQQGRAWPDIDGDSEIFHKANQAAYTSFRPLLEGAPGDTRAQFVKFFAAGSNGEDRPAAADWVQALAAARQPPKFDFVTVDREVALEGTEVKLSWATEGAERVESPTLGELDPSGTMSVVIERSQEFRLIAVNLFGKAEMSSRLIRVVPLPRLTTIPVPGFPGLALRTKLSTPVLPPVPMQIKAPRLAPPLELPPRRSLPTNRLAPGVQALPGLPSFNGFLRSPRPRIGERLQKGVRR